MARLYSNENFPIPVVESLRILGHDVLTIQEQGRSNEAVPDPEVLRFAISENRALLTSNRKDFIRLHSGQPQHTGIIVCTIDPDFARQAQRIHEAIQHYPVLNGLLIRVHRPA